MTGQLIYLQQHQTDTVKTADDPICANKKKHLGSNNDRLRISDRQRRGKHFKKRQKQVKH